MKTLIRNGGRFNARNYGNGKVTLTIPNPPDRDGRLARMCPRNHCSPGYFKIRPGATNPPYRNELYCPYCRHKSSSDGFQTTEQQRYANEILLQEAQVGFDRNVKEILGLGTTSKRTIGNRSFSISVEFTPSRLAPVRQPVEEILKRDVVCPHCAQDQTVFGLAIWCAGCGEDIFLTHVEKEIAALRTMLLDIPRRRKELGPRVAAKDLENALEDAVSVFEAAVKALVRRAMGERGQTPEAIEDQMHKLGNAFQNIAKTIKHLLDSFGFTPGIPDSWRRLDIAFKKRHPITHNLGVIDRKYLLQSGLHGRVGRELRIQAKEVETALQDVLAVVSDIHSLVRSE